MSDDPKDVSENIENIERIDSEIAHLENKCSRRRSQTGTGLGEDDWARSYRDLTRVALGYGDEIKRLRDENDKLKLALMHYADNRFQN
jgi:hypothetical protein